MRKQKAKIPTLETLEPHVAALYKAVAAYVKHYGGSVIVIGGATMQQWPQDNANVYHIAVKCMGRLPTFPGGKVTTASF